MSDLVAHLHVKFCTINALLKHYVLIASRQCFNSVSVKCLGPFFFPYGFLSLPRELIRLLLATANSFFGCMHRSSRSRSGFKINIPSMDLSFKKVSVVKIALITVGAIHSG